MKRLNLCILARIKFDTSACVYSVLSYSKTINMDEEKITLILQTALKLNEIRKKYYKAVKFKSKSNQF